MTPFSSLRSRIFLTSALLAVLAIAVALYQVNDRVTGEADRALQREIVSTGALVDQLRTTTTQAFTRDAELIADASATLKAAVDTNDPATVQDIADGYRRQLNSTVVVVTNRSGVVLAMTGGPAHAVAASGAIRDALTGHERLTLVPQPDGILQLVTVPITIGIARPEIMGTLSVGFLLDNALAAQLKELTGSDIAFGMDGRVLASTLPRDDADAVGDLLTRDGISHVRLGGQDYVALRRPLAQAASTAMTASQPASISGVPVALVLRSRTEQLRYLDAIHTGLGVTAVVVVLLATILSFAVARTITRPLAAITDVMREVAATGDLTRKITLRAAHRWDDEDARLLAATFNTLTDSIARFQRDIAQRERLSSLGRLSTVIAHEIRNPLMIIKAALHTLRQPDANREAVRDAAADIDEEVARLNRIVNEVLDFARPIRFERAPTDVNALCRESAAAAEAAGAAAGPPIALDLDPALRPMITDGERLRLALVNMLVNARQAVAARDAQIAAGGAPLPADGASVTLRTRAGTTHASIVVADRGAGIDPADLPRVFDPYFTTKRGGTGLGLAITKNIVEGLGGTISVTSARGEGTEIRLELPMAAEAGGV